MNNAIANWDTLSDEEKKKATDLLKGQPGLNAATVHPAAKFFEGTAICKHGVSEAPIKQCLNARLSCPVAC